MLPAIAVALQSVLSSFIGFIGATGATATAVNLAGQAAIHGLAVASPWLMGGLAGAGAAGVLRRSLSSGSRSVTFDSQSWVGDHRVENIAVFESDAYFQSRNEPYQWFSIDFHNQRFRPTHYAIRSDILKSWVVEGSTDGRNWRELDRQTDNTVLTGGSYAAIFLIQHPIELRYIRLIQTGKNCDGNDILRLYGFDLGDGQK
jgi:hypothetical protein